MKTSEYLWLSWQALQDANLHRQYIQANLNESARVIAYWNDGSLPVPTVVTPYGKHLVSEAQAYWQAIAEEQPSNSISPSTSPSASDSTSISVSASSSESGSTSSSPSSSRSPSVSPSPSASKSPSHSVSASPSPSAAPVLGTIPHRGYSTGAVFTRWSAADQNFIVNEAVKCAHGKPFAMRIDAWNDTNADAMIQLCLAKNITPYIVLYGTTGPISVSGLGQRIATKYRGKGLIFTGPNEPDLHNWGADQLADFCKANYQQVKAGDPNALCGYAAMWKGGAGLQAYARSAAARAKGYFDFFPFHGYDDPTQHANWVIWDYIFDGGYYGTNTVQSIFRNAGINVPFVSDECGSTASGQAQWDTNKRFLDQAPNRVIGSFIYCQLPDVTTFNIYDANRTPHIAATNMINYP